MHFSHFWAACMVAVFLVPGCSPGGDEPATVTLPVVTDNAGVEVCTSNTGWEVEITGFVVAIENLEFTVEGETHASLLQRISDFVIPVAYAHPGHLAGGDVTGELAGTWIIDFLADAPQSLGEATLLEGVYNGVNFQFAVAPASSGPVSGHTAFVSGTATKEGASVPFEALLDMPVNTQMVGGVFDLEVDGQTDVTLALQVHTVDYYEGDTLFADIDFDALPLNDDGVAVISGVDAAHNLLMKALQVHDHWAVVAR